MEDDPFRIEHQKTEHVTILAMDLRNRIVCKPTSSCIDACDRLYLLDRTAPYTCALVSAPLRTWRWELVHQPRLPHDPVKPRPSPDPTQTGLGVGFWGQCWNIPVAEIMMRPGSRAYMYTNLSAYLYLRQYNTQSSPLNNMNIEASLN